MVHAGKRIKHSSDNQSDFYESELQSINEVLVIERDRRQYYLKHQDHAKSGGYVDSVDHVISLRKNIERMIELRPRK